MKNLLQRWFGSRPDLTPDQSARLDAWCRLPPSPRTTCFEESRYVVLDVETTGLNLVTDSLISIGAVAVVNNRIAIGDHFSIVLQQREASRKENILIHGISGSEQRDGLSPEEALLAFLEFLGNAPLVAFHVAFDETMIRRAIKQYLGFKFNHPWLDLAYVMPALNPELMHTHRVLDDWAQQFGIFNEARHNALADALATAQLLLVAMAQIRHSGGGRSFDGLRSLERTYRHVRQG